MHLPAVRHFIDLHRAERGASPPIPVTLPDDPRGAGFLGGGARGGALCGAFLCLLEAVALSIWT